MVIVLMVVLVTAVENDDNDLIDDEGDKNNDTADEIFGDDGSGISRDSDGDDDYEKG